MIDVPCELKIHKLFDLIWKKTRWPPNTQIPYHLNTGQRLTIQIANTSGIQFRSPLYHTSRVFGSPLCLFDKIVIMKHFFNFSALQRTWHLHSLMPLSLDFQQTLSLLQSSNKDCVRREYLSGQDPVSFSQDSGSLCRSSPGTVARIGAKVSKD